MKAPPGAPPIGLKVVPFTEVKAASDPADVTVPGSVDWVDGAAVIPLQVRGDGEFAVVVDAGGESYQLAVVSEGGRVWVGEGTIGSLLQERLLRELKQEVPAAQLKEAFGVRYHGLLEKRSRQGAVPRNAAGRAARVLEPTDIAAGDLLHFKAEWQGPVPDDPADPAIPANLTMFGNFPVDGIRVEVCDASSNERVAVTHLVDGHCSFVAPVAMFRPKITLVATFPGITPTGETATAGGGIGGFDVEDNAGNPYTFEVPEPLALIGKTGDEAGTLVFDRSAGHGGDNLAQVMSVFHCVADMVRELKVTIGEDKAPGFKVVFPQPGASSFYSRTDLKLHITGVRAYVWDVIGHEFGHMVQHDTGSIDSQGGSHNGSNQYEYESNASTYRNKELSNRLALNEGYGTWVGVAFTERSARYADKLKWVGDKLYRDWVNLEGNSPRFRFGASAYKGEDTELAVQALLWDLHDDNGESYAATGRGDRTALGMKRVFERFKGKNMQSVSDVWRELFVPGGDMANLTGATRIDAEALDQALDAAVTFAEFGIAPHLFIPADGGTLDLARLPGPRVRWRQYATGDPEMNLNRFQLILYSGDRTEVLWKSEVFAGDLPPLVRSGSSTHEYQLQENDLNAINRAVRDRNDRSAVFALLGSSSLAPETGSYLSPGVAVQLQPVNRAMVVVLDCSETKSSTDPGHLGVDVAKSLLERLVSSEEAVTDPPRVPDLAALVGFNKTAEVLVDFGDPDEVASALDGLGFSGGARVDRGIRAAVEMLDRINIQSSLAGSLRDRASIVVLSRGRNRTGQAAVVRAIRAATEKGYRVHYADVSPGAVVPPAALAVRLSRGRWSRAPDRIAGAVLGSGGVFSRLVDDGSRSDFVDRVNASGAIGLLAVASGDPELRAVGFLDGSFVLEIDAAAGIRGQVQYSDDGGMSWEVASPPFEGRGVPQRWLDAGPPGTRIHPDQVPSRWYRLSTP
ncbi:vWA domain-containing protein [Luteolibacter marinus]|uniref:vWA domain-containing protein n=1 Tax=Luteolibacter marinus TaxID=2776705 RepID=UPI0018694990